MKKVNKQSCQASLRINGATYEGSTGKNTGHAEMDALDQFCIAMYNDAPGGTAKAKSLAALTACTQLLAEPRVSKVVSCPSRPCCRKCTSVLRQLGFERGAKTEWSDTPMGSTEWGASPDVQALLGACGIDYEAVQRLA